MTSLLKKYKPVIRFVLLFLGVYILLSLLYGLYLDVSKDAAYKPDFITNLVAKQSSNLISNFGYDAQVSPNKIEPTMRLTVNDKYLAKIVEGCNAISIIILFIAFIIAFAEGFRKTFFFLLAGVTLIYSINILRIVILAISLYEYPQHEEILHGVIFPALIYGMVFLLWMVWVRTLKKEARDE
ncbi:exosortase family protein XrtF [Patiriisocius hiemis]|uniref:Exosortase family protein XrtF n=1 Tax=Patiriisocius hiemis TaxID=3075604 RepID=A0ABU2YDI4_9FLAO|nr:exosortase family protein XrtF [Constantimarinum sp. W242]MDT0556246.1 exosortase family protein XrtF [Constantimarinum sp. W242]